MRRREPRSVAGKHRDAKDHEGDTDDHRGVLGVAQQPRVDRLGDDADDEEDGDETGGHRRADDQGAAHGGSLVARLLGGLHAEEEHQVRRQEDEPARVDRRHHATQEGQPEDVGVDRRGDHASNSSTWWRRSDSLSAPGLGDDLPVGGDEQRHGKLGDPQRIAERALVIHQQLVVDPPLLGKALHVLDVVERVDADESNLISEVGLDGGEVGQFTGTRRTRRVPEVDDHRPPVGTQDGRGSVDGHQLDLGEHGTVVRRIRHRRIDVLPGFVEADDVAVVGNRAAPHQRRGADHHDADSTTTWARSDGRLKATSRGYVGLRRGGAGGGFPAPPRGLLVRRRSRRVRRRVRR